MGRESFRGSRRSDHDPVGAAWAAMRRTGRATVRERLLRLRLSVLVAVQCGVAAAVAWWVAKDLVNNPQPLFAPAVAVGTIASSVSQRFRRTLLLIAGVAVGITLGDLLVSWLGRGYVQIGAIVAVSILFAVFLSGEGSFITQVGGSAMVIAVLFPASTGVALPRFLDGVVGGVVGILVSVVVLPLHPIYRIRRAARPLLNQTATELERLAHAARTRDAELAKQVLDALRHIDTSDVETALSAAVEVVRISPLRWHNRSSLQGWRRGVRLMMRSLLQSRGLRVSGINVANDVTIIAVNTIRAGGVSKRDAEALRCSLAPDTAGEPADQHRAPDHGRPEAGPPLPPSMGGLA
ncbi:FUSC family protein [Micromonospora costi]|uniref:Aromatic acid exporter family protein n=1 Tax=Micromonospora costi TaxID=1530042 RepID=A0A3B0AB97_9ACTN|nr:FUSC family protein [Micromonospora costi]RKN57902.1 aromatic acid exporter family protein [Micromonospora costi]